jgi:hypothetical protein
MEYIVEIDCEKIVNWESFHDEFFLKMGFPDFYGRNMNAWIDCMSSLSDPEDGMTTIHCSKGGVVTLALLNALQLKNNYPEIYEAIIECSAFVNYRLIKVGEPSVLALAYDI